MTSLVIIVFSHFRRVVWGGGQRK